jgi:hypothetical protein
MKTTCVSLCFIIVLFFSVRSHASAQLSPGFTGAGFRLSFVVPQYYNVGFGLGAHADIRIIQVFHFYPSIEYCLAGSGIAGSEWINGVHYNRYIYLNEFAINGDFRFYPPLHNLAIKPFAGGGVAFVVSGEYNSYVGVTDERNRTHNTQTSTDLGLDMLLGLDIPINKIVGTFEMKVRMSPEYAIFKITGGLTFPVGVSLAKKNP